MSIVSVDFHEKNELFQKNVKCFPEYLRRQLQMENLGDVENSINIVHTKEGYPICQLKQEGRVKSINSRRPWDEAAHWCNQLPLDQMSTVFVYGCGFGYSLVELLKRVHEDTWVVVFEQNLPIFIAMLHYFDLEPIFRIHPKCIFFLGSFEDFSDHFQMLISTNKIIHLTVPSALYTPGSRMFKKEYLAIQFQVFERMIQQITSFGNDHFDSLLGFHNMIDNVDIILKNPYLSSIKNKFTNVPVFIVANGPSLDQSIHELKKVGEKGLILCCESAIVPLTKNGIKPDAICVLERIPESYLYHFQNKEYPDEITLLALAVADPRTFSSFAGPKIPIFRRFESTSQWLNQLVSDGSGLYAGLNVSHLAYELAVYMGANPIVFIGQNYAYGLDGRTHSKQSKYTEEGQDYIAKIKSLPIVNVEGNDGLFLPSNPLWVEFRKGLERMIEMTPNVKVINTTEGGAKIKGAAFEPLSTVVDQYCKESLPYRLDILLKEDKKDIKTASAKSKVKRLKFELNNHTDIFRALDLLAGERKAKIEHLLENSIKKDEQNRKELRGNFDQNHEHVMKFLHSHVHHLFFQQIILFSYHQLNGLGAITTPEKLRYALRIQFHLFEHLSVICQSLIRNYQLAFEKLAFE